MRYPVLNLFLLLLIPTINIAQQRFDFGYERINSITVKDSTGHNLTMPWAGGLNAPHFEKMDLNLDGIMDLITFDTHGNRLMTYINTGIKDSSSYTYAPEYENAIPKCISWLQTYDYNHDGKMDIFTYIPGGIRVFKNTSTASKLHFTQVTYMLNYMASSGFPINIYVSSVDFPAFVDVDLDGDMDILTFHVLGAYVVWYRNYSMERYGIPDSLDFKIYDKCWGKFAEGENNNAVFLNQTCNYKSDVTAPKSDAKHTGSTLLSLDLNGDSLMDLILGDVDYFTINGLINGGTRDSAHIVSQDTSFPDVYPVDIVTFPSINYLDLNNDSIDDLLVAPFDPSYYKVNSLNGVWLYKNNGANNYPNFHLSKKGFFQDRMIDVGDGALPTIVDVDGDGLKDIVIGNYGNVDSTHMDSIWYILEIFKVSKLCYYKNIGTSTAPAFQYEDGNWLNLRRLKKKSLKTTFGDLDGDGDEDLLIGSDDGQLIYKENIAGPNHRMSFGPNQFYYQNIDVGDYSSPQLIDIDGDSLLDLVIGNKLGLLSYYKNTGTRTNAQFTLITDTMGGIKTSSYYYYYNGYSVPCFYYNAQDSLEALVGSASGYTFYYKDIRRNIHGNFGVDSNLLYVDIIDTLYSIVNFTNEGNILETVKTGLRSAPAIYDFNNDGYKDILMGTFTGGINYYQGIEAPFVGIQKSSQKQNIDIALYPNPANNYINIEIRNTEKPSQTRVIVYDLSGRIVLNKTYTTSLNTRIAITNFVKGIYIVKVDIINNKKEHSFKAFKLIKL